MDNVLTNKSKKMSDPEELKPSHDFKKIGVYHSSANLMNIILGTGILYIPIALQNSGFILGLVLLLLVCLMGDYVCVQLIKMAKKKNIAEFEKLGEETYGRVLFYVTCVFCFVFAFGALINYTDLVNSTIKSFFATYVIKDDKKLEWMSILITCGLFALVVIPLSLFRNLSMLSWTSILSVFAFGVIAIIVTITGILLDDIKTKSLKFTFESLLSAFGTLSFSFVCTDSIFPVYLGLQDRTQARWNKVTHITAFGIGLLYAIFSSICYFLIPDLSDFVLNSPSISSKLQINICKLLLAFTILLTYAVNLHVARTYIYAIIEKAFCRIDSLPRKRYLILHIGVTMTIIVISMVLGLAVNDLLFVVGLTGCLSSTAVGFIIPVMIIFKVKTIGEIWKNFREAFTRKMPFLKRMKNVNNLVLPIIILAFGVLGLVAGVPLIIKDFVESKK